MKGSDEMPQVRCLDDGSGHPHPKSEPLRKKKTLRVRESTQIRNDGIRRRADWPFFYVIEGGRTYINSAPRRKTARVEEEEARW